jgi:hypothetical protein
VTPGRTNALAEPKAKNTAAPGQTKTKPKPAAKKKADQAAAKTKLVRGKTVTPPGQGDRPVDVEPTAKKQR